VDADPRRLRSSSVPTALPEVHPGVQLWLVDLDAPAPADDAALLSPDETARAARFVFERHRRRFVAGRSALRRVLEGATGRGAKSLMFAYGPAGKPSLAGGGDPDLQFNLSHSEQWAVVAVSRVGRVGVDIEQRRPLADVLRLAGTAFSDREIDELRCLPASRQEDAFFTGWTRKEAYIKAGGGKLVLLGDFDVSLAPDEARLLRVAGAPLEHERWTLASFVPLAGYAGALCVERATSSSADRR
jgi:4'-phosphopantetheinyl transferase